MTKVVDAIYSNGVLKPVEALDLGEQERIKVVVHTTNGAGTPPAGTPGWDLSEPMKTEAERQVVLTALFDEIDRANLHLGWHIPSREELYDRF